MTPCRLVNVSEAVAASIFREVHEQYAVWKKQLHLYAGWGRGLQWVR
jgi:uncharacterized protein YbdZ (MbtH family)